MRINSISSSMVQSCVPVVQKKEVLHNDKPYLITFTGEKNIYHFASIAPENKRYKLNAYNQGGLGVVTYEAANSWRLREGADVRDFAPYHSYDSSDGGIKVVKRTKDSNGNYLPSYPEKNFFTAKADESLDDVAKRLNLSEGEELSFVIQEKPDAKGNCRYITLVDEGISGSITRPSVESVTKTEIVPYRVFRAIDIADPVDLVKEPWVNAAPKVPERNAVYFVHIKELARFENAYGAGQSGGYGTYGSYGTYGTYGSYGTTGIEGGKTVSTNVSYADYNRAVVDFLPQLNTPEHGNYNPANLWMHDRPSFIAMSAIADESYFGNPYYRGIKAHGSFHNPGRDYQGAENNPFEFFRMVARKEDVEKLNKHPQIKTLIDIEKRWSTASHEEKRFVNQILRPFMENFLDDFVDGMNDIRTYNISMSPVAAVRLNPHNMSAGTVSVNYGKEMKSADTPDIAKFMTSKLAEIETIDVTNGSTPANLRLNDPNADFCRSGEINGITKLKEGFTPYEYRPVFDKNGKLVSDNIKEVVKAKRSNTYWLLSSLQKAYKKGGQNGLVKMFFSDSQISKGATVIGHIANVRKDDILLMGWGRPDPQKGYPSTFQAYLDFLKDKTIDSSLKKRVKLIVGAGVWDKYARDYTWVQDILRQIEELDGGIYKGNACYVNGFFSNRLVGCATYTIFSSRYEPCGITPLESFASGTPCISTKTGGAPDFIAPSRGYLTKNPYLLSPDKLKIDAEAFQNKTSTEIGEIIDGRRMLSNATELKDCIASAVSDFLEKPGKGKLSKYTNMSRDAISQRIDWHENREYNGGKSANERFMTDIFEVDKGMQNRRFDRLRRFVSENFGIADTMSDNLQKFRNKWTKAIILAGVGIAGLGTIGYTYLQRKSSSDKNTFEKIA